jgi:hypothetical protein
MPRTNRLTRAYQHSNIIVGGIMILQETAQFFRRRLLNCCCSELEAELSSVQEELNILQALYTDYQVTNEQRIEQLQREVRNLKRSCNDIRVTFIVFIYSFL